jgi:hypothetical protein
MAFERECYEAYPNGLSILLAPELSIPKVFQESTKLRGLRGEETSTVEQSTEWMICM